MKELNFKDDEVKKMSSEDIATEIVNFVYYQSLFFEQLESYGIIRGNGHHMAQEMAEKAKEIFFKHLQLKT